MAVHGQLSRKCRYALEAMFELALRKTNGLVKVQDIAAAQAIPQRFLEVILAELKHGGFVESTRGNAGGYALARPADGIPVGDIICFLEGGKLSRNGEEMGRRSKMGSYAFSQLWHDVGAATSDIYERTTFADLVEQELTARQMSVADYAI